MPLEERRARDRVDAARWGVTGVAFYLGRTCGLRGGSVR